MTAPLNPFGIRRRRFQPEAPPDDFALDSGRYDEAMAFGDATDDVDDMLAPKPARRFGFRDVASGIASGLASEMDPDARGFEGFLGGLGRGYTRQQDQVREDEETGLERELLARKLKADMLGLEYQRRRLDRDERDPLADERRLRSEGLGRYYQAPEAPRTPQGSDFEFITGPTGQVQRVPRVGPVGVVPGVTARVPPGDADPVNRAKPGSPEHRSAWLASRIRQFRKANEFGEIMDLNEAVDEATAEYEAAYPPPPKPQGPNLPRGGGPSPYMRRTQGGPAPAPAVPFESRVRQLERQFGGDPKRIADQLRQEGYDFDE